MAKSKSSKKKSKATFAPIDPAAWSIAVDTTPDLTTNEDGRALEIEDLYAWHLPGNPQVSPDESKIVFEVLSIHKESDEYRSTLYLIDGDADPRALTSGQWSDTNPLFSPDGTELAFLRNRDDKKNQIFILPLSGGEARQVTHIDSGVNEYRWSPVGNRFVFTSRIAPEKDDDSDVKVITSAYYKFDGMGFIEDKVSHIFTVTAEGGDHHQVTEGNFQCSGIDVAPNGNDVAFISNRNENWDITRGRDLWIIGVNTGGLRQITATGGDWSTPVFSPDGSRIAVIGDEDVMAENPNSALYVLKPDGSDLTRLAPKLDRGIGDSGMSGPTGAAGRTLRWTQDGTAIEALVSDLGDTHVVRFPRNGRKPTRLTPAGYHVKAFAPLGDDLIVSASTPARPAEISKLSESGEHILTHFNDDWVNQVHIPLPEEIRFESDGEEIQGWLVRPKGNTTRSKGKKKAPVILNIHGGPHAQFSPAFFHELQMYVARGFALVFINPRGSTGRSNDFARAVNAKWGFADMPDFMAAIDHVIALGGLDESRMGVTGGSYGGFSTNWLLGHTDRFKAAVTDRSISNMASMYGTDDISLVGFDLALGTPWENPDTFWKASPLAYVDKFTAPLLIVHSEHDYRCPMEQAEQLFMALKKLGKTVEFVRFPDESHGLGRNGKPKHRVERLRRTLEWFEKYL